MNNFECSSVEAADRTSLDRWGKVNPQHGIRIHGSIVRETIALAAAAIHLVFGLSFALYITKFGILVSPINLIHVIDILYLG